MARVLRAGAVFVLALGTMWWLAEWQMGARTRALGRTLYRHRGRLEKLVERRPARHPFVVWLGDSTILGVRHPSYPTQIGRRLAATAPVETRVVAMSGLGFYEFYYLAGRVLALEPDLVVALAHLRMFAFAGSNRGLDDLASWIPAGEFANAAWLPWSARGLTVARLALLRAFEIPAVRDAIYLGEGLRRTVQDAVVEGPRGPAAPLRQLTRVQGVVLGGYNAEITPRRPTVRMMGATVRTITRRRVPMLVVATPIPYEVLAARGLYEPEVYRRRVEVLRDVTEQNGGSFLDLHVALRSEELSDSSGHYTAEGTARLVELVEPAVRRALGMPSADSAAPGPAPPRRRPAAARP